MKTKVETSKAPQASTILSQGIISGNTIYVAGQIHMTPEGKLVEGTTEEKLKQVMDNIQAILKAANTNLDDIVKATIYVTDMSLVGDINKVYATYFNEPYPAREAICVKELPLGASLEISVIATK